MVAFVKLGCLTHVCSVPQSAEKLQESPCIFALTPRQVEMIRNSRWGPAGSGASPRHTRHQTKPRDPWVPWVWVSLGCPCLICQGRGQAGVGGFYDHLAGNQEKDPWVAYAATDSAPALPTGSCSLE